MRVFQRLVGSTSALALFTVGWASSAKADEYKIMDIETPDVSTCLDIDPNSGVFGAFKNSCGYRVAFVMCVIEPTPGSWGASNPCVDGRGPGNLDFVAANGVQASHIKGGKGVQWFACRYSPTPGVGNYSGIMRGSIVYEKGRGIKGKCGVTARVLASISAMPPTAGELAKQGSAGQQPQTGSGAGGAAQGGNMASRMFENSTPQSGTQSGAASSQAKPPEQPGAPLAAPPTNMANRVFNSAPATPIQPKPIPPLITDGTAWIPKTINGCTFFLNSEYLWFNSNGTSTTDGGSILNMSYSGGCGANGLAQGNGTVTYDVSGADYTRSIMTGPFNNGIMSGTFRFQDFERNNGQFVLRFDDGGPHDNMIPINGGCHEYDQYCNPSAGRSVRDRWLAGVR